MFPFYINATIKLNDQCLCDTLASCFKFRCKGLFFYLSDENEDDNKLNFNFLRIESQSPPAGRAKNNTLLKCLARDFSYINKMHFRVKPTGCSFVLFFSFSLKEKKTPHIWVIRFYWVAFLNCAWQQPTHLNGWSLELVLTLTPHIARLLWCSQSCHQLLCVFMKKTTFGVLCGDIPSLCAFFLCFCLSALRTTRSLGGLLFQMMARFSGFWSSKALFVVSFLCCGLLRWCNPCLFLIRIFMHLSSSVCTTTV